MNASGSVAQNRQRGLSGEAAFEAYARCKGYTVVRPDGMVKTPFGNRLPDFLVRSPKGSQFYVEVKSGNGRRTRKQRQKDAYINANRGQFDGNGIYLIRVP